MDDIGRTIFFDGKRYYFPPPLAGVKALNFVSGRFCRELIVLPGDMDCTVEEARMAHRDRPELDPLGWRCRNGKVERVPLEEREDFNEWD